MFSSSIVSFWRGYFWGHFWEQFWRGFSSRRIPTNLVRLIVSQITSYIVSFNILCSAVQKFRFGGDILGGFLPPEEPQIWLNNCLPSNFLHCEFQLYMFSSSKVLYRGHFGGSSPRRALNLVRLIVSEISSYIVSFNFLVLAVQKFHFKGPFGEGVIFGKPFWRCLPLRTPKFGQNNWFPNSFLHCEFQLYMFSSSKVSF